MFQIFYIDNEIAVYLLEVSENYSEGLHVFPLMTTIVKPMTCNWKKIRHLEQSKMPNAKYSSPPQLEWILLWLYIIISAQRLLSWLDVSFLYIVNMNFLYNEIFKSMFLLCRVHVFAQPTVNRVVSR